MNFCLKTDVLGLLKDMFCLNPNVLSAFVAFCALALTVFQLYYKSIGKMAEKNTDLFSKYLYIIQQVELGISSVEGLKKLHIEPKMSHEKIIGYAKAHMMDDDIFQTIYKFVELAIPCFNDKDKKVEQKKVKKALEFCSTATGLANSINSFYQSLLASPTMNYTDAQIDEVYNRLSSDLRKLKDIPAQGNANVYREQDIESEESFLSIMRKSVYKKKINGVSFVLPYIIFCLIFYIIFCLRF